MRHVWYTLNFYQFRTSSPRFDTEVVEQREHIVTLRNAIGNDWNGGWWKCPPANERFPRFILFDEICAVQI